MDFVTTTEEALGHRCGVLDGKYKLFCTIGNGQFAKYRVLLPAARVKLAQSIDTLEWFAIKIMKEQQVNTPEKLLYFMNEIRLLSLSPSKHVVELFSASISGTIVTPAGKKKLVVYYVMSYAKHGELYRLVRETGRFSEALARTFFVQLLEGVEFLHSIGIAHRDIKPENLVLDAERNLLIADFGSAARSQTETNKPVEFDSAFIVGSQEYNAPEINMDKFYYGDKADAFSCGVCLFVMVVGTIPFRIASNSDPYFELLSQKDKSHYWEIYEGIPLSPEFKDLFEQLTDRNVEKRLSLSAAKLHPWIKGKVFGQPELLEEMKDRLQLFSIACRKDLEEKKEKPKWCLSKSAAEGVFPHKHSDPFVQGCMAECVEINTALEKRRAMKPPGADEEKLSDDQVNSNSDDNAEESEPPGSGTISELRKQYWFLLLKSCLTPP